MRASLFIIFILFFTADLFAQKKIIDSIAYNQWPILEGEQISNNGEYVKYNIKNLPVGSSTVVIQSTNGKWKLEFIGHDSNKYEMTADGNYLLYPKGKEGIALLRMGTDQEKYISNVYSYRMRGEGDSQILCYYLNAKPNTLVLRWLKTGKEYSLNNVIEEQTVDLEKMLLVSQTFTENPKYQLVSWVDLVTHKVNKVWKGLSPKNLKIDARSKQLVFTSGDSLMYYKLGFPTAICLIKSISALIGSDMVFRNFSNFSKDGTRLLISMKKNEKIKPAENAMEVWSYKDINLQSEQKQNSPVDSYLASIDLGTKKIVFFDLKPGDQLRFPKDAEASDTLALVINNQNVVESWSLASKMRYNLLNLITGRKKSLGFLDDNRTVTISSGGKYLTYYNYSNKDYFSYEIKTNAIRNLTRSLNTTWCNRRENDRYGMDEFPRGWNEHFWLNNDRLMLVYDECDLWILDPLNKLNPVNLTNGYGKRHNIVFSFALEKVASNKSEKIFLRSFDGGNKENGFYIKKLGKVGDPELLIKGKYAFSPISTYLAEGAYIYPIKAKSAESYLVRRMSAVDAPNYFYTKDFKNFLQLTYQQPQKEYSWYTTELHQWKSLDGNTLSGILYKPENFDPKKKYPIIFHYYERVSDGLNAFITPKYSYGTIDIPTYVSNGYLVFCPDIYYKIGDPMQGTYDSVISAALYISKFPFVDFKRMGLQGHSFGGVQTNYLVTHSNLFTAACSSSGLSDWISNYGALEGNVKEGYGESLSKAFDGKMGQLRMGQSLWQNLEGYIKNSPIFYVDNVTTPLLLMHTEDDKVCPYPNILEFFLGLRRMGKKVWMLVYKNVNHSLPRGDWESKDFTVRMQQFFDHYLMDKPAPIWMTRGLPASRIASENDLMYDSLINTPGAGLLKKQEQVKADSLKRRTSIKIVLK